MNVKVIYLLLLVCCCSTLPVTSIPQEGVDEERGTDSRVSPEHQASNNHFSSSTTDEDAPSTVSPGLDHTAMDPLEPSPSPTDDDEPGKVSIPPEVPTTHKADAKKDPKKKAKSTPKKKDKNSEELIEGVPESTDENVVDTTVAIHVDITTDVPDLIPGAPDETTFIPTTTTVPEMSHMVVTEETTGTFVQTEMATTSSEPHLPTTTKHENLLSSDEQPPQTTTNEDMLESMTTTLPAETMKPQLSAKHLTTTDIPETEATTPSDALIVTENNEDAVHHLHSEDTISKSDLDLTSVSPGTTTITEESKSDNNSLSNDLEDMERATTTSAPESNSEEVTSVRKQKQMDLEGSCPCNERGTSLDPSECVGGRTAADPNCPCREVCARQTGQSCSPGEPCDEEFGLHCNPQNNTCTAQCVGIVA